jgi:hypothetical protein
LAGGKYVELPITLAIANTNLVTAPPSPAHPRWLAMFLNVLGTKIQHQNTALVQQFYTLGDFFKAIAHWERIVTLLNNSPQKARKVLI